MEKATRERLTGAVIFFALLAIAVPELLLGPGAGPPPAESEADVGPPQTTYDLSLIPTSDAELARQQQLAAKPAAATTAIEAAVPPPVIEPPRVIEPPPVIETPPASSPVVEDGAREQATTASSPAGAWWVQIGSFSSGDNARNLARDLRASGYAIEVALVKAGGRELHRVRAGPAAGREAAAGLRDRLAREGHEGTLVAP